MKPKRLCQFETGEQHQVVGHHCRPDVGLEVVEPAPGAAYTAIDRKLDSLAERSVKADLAVFDVKSMRWLSEPSVHLDKVK